MEILVLFFIGIVQGLTEFLPVSSSGHIVLLSKIFNVEESLFLSVLLHFATLLSIVVTFRKDISEMIKNPFSKRTMTVAVATIPTCVMALVLMPLIETAFVGSFLPFCFFTSAVILLLGEYFSRKGSQKPLDYKSAIIIGIAQGFAVFPGISRSASTISAALANGNEKQEAVKFSFLMSIPIILASMILEVIKIAKTGISISCPIGVCLAFFGAFVFGIIAIKFVLKIAQKASFVWFSLYLFVLSICSLFLLWCDNLFHLIITYSRSFCGKRRVL